MRAYPSDRYAVTHLHEAVSFMDFRLAEASTIDPDWDLDLDHDCAPTHPFGKRRSTDHITEEDRLIAQASHVR